MQMDSKPSSQASKFVHTFWVPHGPEHATHLSLGFALFTFSPAESPVPQYTYNVFRNTLSVETGRPKRWPVICKHLGCYAHSLASVGFSLDGIRMVSCCTCDEVRVWDVVRGTDQRDPPLGPCLVLFSRVSPNGTHIFPAPRTVRFEFGMPYQAPPIGKLLQGHSEAVKSLASLPMAHASP